MIKTMLTVSALFLLCVSATAHEGSVIYPIFELPPSQLPDLHDGTLADWEAALPNASLTHNDFWSFTGEQALQFRVFLGWSLAEQQIYVGVERFDDEFVDGGEMFAIEIDGDHSGGMMWDANMGALSQEQQNLLASNGQRYQYQPRGEERQVFGFGDEWAWSRTVPFMDVGIDDVGERPNQLILEMMLTLWDRLDPEGLESSRQSVLRSGNIIGFQITLIDGDENAFGLYAITESLPEERYNTDVFVDGELLPCDLPGCSQNTTAVRNDSWAKIKISLNTR